MTLNSPEPAYHGAAPHRSLHVVEHKALGVQVAYEPTLMTPAIRRAFEEHWYECGEALAARDVISAEDRALELGGGIGVVASHVWTKTRCTYHAYEANPYLLPSLDGTLALNRATSVIVHNTIVTDEISLVAQGWGELALHEDFWMSNTDAKTGDQRVTVPVASLSEVVARYRPTVIISDIEGGEIGAFAVSSLQSVHSIVVVTWIDCQPA